MRCGLAKLLPPPPLGPPLLPAPTLGPSGASTISIPSSASSPDAVRSRASWNLGATLRGTWNQLSWLPIRIAPISLRVIWPRRHSSGSIQRGSAFCWRPTAILNHTMSSKPGRCASFCALSRASGVFAISSSGSGILARCEWTSAAAISSADIFSINCAASLRSSEEISLVSVSCPISRSRSFSRIASGVGASFHSAVIFAPRSMPSTRRRRLYGTTSTAVPFLPARPVRPERCWSVSASRGISTCTTRLTLGRSIPRAATSVATQTRARRSRSACKAWLRSDCECSPDSATTPKPRSCKVAWRRRTLSRVAQNRIAVSAS